MITPLQSSIRQDGRQFDQPRPLSFQPDFAGFATSSVLTSCGQTRVLITVSIEDKVPKFLTGSGQGWLTAEYRMLPGATHERYSREFMKLSGRTQEIQRLIGRSLRSCLDMKLLGEKTITIDADVLQADAGTRTTAITGGYVALALAIDKLLAAGRLTQTPLVNQVAAVSVGWLEGTALLDLNYLEDVAASVDFNVVMNNKGQLIEVQGTAEEGSFSRGELNQILDLAELGIGQFFTAQREILGLS
jgi:ribonuclease PH